MNTTIEILKAARDLIAKPENWTQGAYARFKDGHSSYPDDEFALCFCSLGAIAKVTGSCIEAEILTSKMRKALGVADDGALAEFNDRATHSEVLDLFSKAISSAEEKQGAAS